MNKKEKSKGKKLRFIEEPSSLEKFRGHEIDGKNIQGGCWGAWLCWFGWCPALKWETDGFYDQDYIT